MADSNEGAVVLLSGGMDSSVLLHHVVLELKREPVHALTFNYGQRHAREVHCATWQAGRLAVAEHRIVDVSFIGELVREGTALVEEGDAVPDLSELEQEERDQPPTYVPNRNMMLLSMAVAYGEANQLFDVFYAAQAQDEYGYWDCTADFVERLNAVLQLNRKQPVTILAPLIPLMKAGIVTKGLALEVDFARTWSCYRGGETPCGTCPTCVERRNAFEDAGVADPLLTVSE